MAVPRFEQAQAGVAVGAVGVESRPIDVEEPNRKRAAGAYYFPSPYSPLLACLLACLS